MSIKTHSLTYQSHVKEQKKNNSFHEDEVQFSLNYSVQQEEVFNDPQVDRSSQQLRISSELHARSPEWQKNGTTH